MDIKEISWHFVFVCSDYEDNLPLTLLKKILFIENFFEKKGWYNSSRFLERQLDNQVNKSNDNKNSEKIIRMNERIHELIQAFRDYKSYRNYKSKNNNNPIIA